jgi:hypothetical protein
MALPAFSRNGVGVVPPKKALLPEEFLTAGKSAYAVIRKPKAKKGKDG